MSRLDYSTVLEEKWFMKKAGSDPVNTAAALIHSETRVYSPKEDSYDRRKGHRLSVQIDPRNTLDASKTSKKFAAFFDELQDILPAETSNRVLEKHEQCIASKIDPAGARCTRRLARSSGVRARLEEMIHSLGLDGDSFLSSLEKFIESAMCGRSHQTPACKILHNLLELNLHALEVSMLRVWLQKLFHVGHKFMQTPENGSSSLRAVHHLDTAGRVIVEKPSEAQGVSSAAATEKRLSQSGTPDQPSERVRMQKRKASTLVPPIEPKRIQNYEGNQEVSQRTPFGNMSPIVISPAETTYDSPSEDDEIFDGELESGSRSQDDDLIATPLTPPTNRITATAGITTPDSPLRRKSKSLLPQGPKDNVAVEDDYFKPRKIFRNTTFLMNSISEKNLVLGEHQYSQELDMKFRVRGSVPLSQASNNVKTSSSSRPTLPRREVAKIEEDHTFESAPEPIAETRSGETIRRTPVEKLLEHIIPFEVQKRLFENETTCAASLKDKCLVRCSHTARKFSKKHMVEQDKLGETSMEALSALQKYGNDNDLNSFLEHIENFTKQALCGSHAIPAKVRMRRLETWLRDTPNARHDLHSTSSPFDSQVFAAWVKAITSSYLQQKVQGHHSSPLIASRRPVPKKAAAILPGVRKGQPGHSFIVISYPVPQSLKLGGEHFERWQPGTTRKKSISEALRQVAMKPLNPSDAKDGFIYIFWLRGIFGLVKIGKTNDPKRRLEQWDKQCKREHEYHRACYDAEMIQREIPHVFRVERLMHTELKEMRVKNKCQCGTTHREWFMDTEDHVLKVFLKWRDWVEQQPYEKDSVGNWTMKPEFEQSLDEICRPLESHGVETLSKKRIRLITRRRSQK